MDFKLELVLVPVSDVNRAKTFYTEEAGFTLDVDHRAGDEFHVVQLTPPGSACSITIGMGVTDAAPGSVRSLHLVGSDLDAARAELAERGVDVSEVKHFESSGWVGAGAGAGSATPRLQLVRVLQQPRRQQLDRAAGQAKRTENMIPHHGESRAREPCDT